MFELYNVWVLPPNGKQYLFETTGRFVGAIDAALDVKEKRYGNGAKVLVERRQQGHQYDRSHKPHALFRMWRSGGAWQERWADMDAKKGYLRKKGIVRADSSP